MGSLSPEGKQSAFSCCDAAVTAGIWGWLPLLPFLAWAGWSYDGTVDGILGFLVMGGLISAVLMMIATMVILWPIALLIRNRPGWWQPHHLMLLGAFVTTTVALWLTQRTAPGSLDDFGVAAVILLCFGIMGVSAGHAASRYYRLTHGDGAGAQTVASTSTDAG
jgi:hypothetical protein